MSDNRVTIQIRHSLRLVRGDEQVDVEPTDVPGGRYRVTVDQEAWTLWPESYDGEPIRVPLPAVNAKKAPPDAG